MNKSGKSAGKTRKNSPMKGSKRGMSGTYDTLILCETVDKEERCRAKFEKASMFMKMPRNPINGELTSREDADYAIPFHHSIMLKLEETKKVYVEPKSPTKLVQYVDEREMTFARPNPKVEDVRRRIESVKQPQLENLRTKVSSMDNEIQQMRKLAEYKRAQLAGTKGETALALPSYTYSTLDY